MQFYPLQEFSLVQIQLDLCEHAPMKHGHVLPTLTQCQEQSTFAAPPQLYQQ